MTDSRGAVKSPGGRDTQNKMKFEKRHASLSMTEGTNGDVVVTMETGGTVASVVVPERARVDMAEALEVAAMALKVWNKSLHG